MLLFARHAVARPHGRRDRGGDRAERLFEEMARELCHLHGVP